MQLLLFGLTHMTEKHAGRALERHIKSTLMDRVSFDTSAKDAMYTMDRCCGWLYQPDVALVRTKEAVAYFAPGDNQAVHRRPLEYYRSLSNYGANLICNSRYTEAGKVHEEIEALIGNYPPGVFPRLDFPRMNAVLVKYRMGVVDAEQASELQGRIVTSLKFDNDPYYAENALAVYLTLAERYEQALATFDRLYAQLTASRRDPEPSMVYLLRANRAASLYLSGDPAACREEWEALTRVVDNIAYAIRPLLVRRHELLGEVIQAGETMPPRAFDECLITRDGPVEFGPLWQNFGHGFRMPEVEFWREN
jgi:tetratricopeptide (TPR) repeat protein